jgi:hypothetical protein
MDNQNMRNRRWLSRFVALVVLGSANSCALLSTPDYPRELGQNAIAGIRLCRSNEFESDKGKIIEDAHIRKLLKVSLTQRPYVFPKDDIPILIEPDLPIIVTLSNGQEIKVTFARTHWALARPDLEPGNSLCTEPYFGIKLYSYFKAVRANDTNSITRLQRELFILDVQYYQAGPSAR